MTIHWNQMYSKRTEINDDAMLNTLRFADDHLLLLTQKIQLS